MGIEAKITPKKLILEKMGIAYFFQQKM